MWHVQELHVDVVERLLQDPRVLAMINATVDRTEGRFTALHFVCLAPGAVNRSITTSGDLLVRMIELLFQAGLDITSGCSPFFPKVRLRLATLRASGARLQIPRQAVKVLEPAWRRRVCAFLINVRRIVDINFKISHAVPEHMDEVEKYFKRVGAVSIYLKSRMEKDQAFPQVMMTQPAPDDDKGRRFRNMVAFVVGLGEVDGKVLPAGVFKLIMDMIMARWHPLRGEDLGKEVEEWFSKQKEEVEEWFPQQAKSPPNRLRHRPLGLQQRPVFIRPHMPLPNAPNQPPPQLNLDFLLTQPAGPSVTRNAYHLALVPAGINASPPQHPPNPNSPPCSQQAEASIASSPYQSVAAPAFINALPPPRPSYSNFTQSQQPGTPALSRNRQFLFENVDDGDNDAALRPGGDFPHKFLWER